MSAVRDVRGAFACVSRIEEFDNTLEDRFHPECGSVENYQFTVPVLGAGSAAFDWPKQRKPPKAL